MFSHILTIILNLLTQISHYFLTISHPLTSPSSTVLTISATAKSSHAATAIANATLLWEEVGYSWNSTQPTPPPSSFAKIIGDMPSFWIEHCGLWCLVGLFIPALLICIWRTRCGKKLRVESGPALKSSSQAVEKTCEMATMRVSPEVCPSGLPFIELDHMTMALYAANIPLPPSPPLPSTLIGTTIPETFALSAISTPTDTSETLIGTPVTAGSEVKDDIWDEPEDWITGDEGGKIQETKVGDVERSLPTTLVGTTIPATLALPATPTKSVFSEISYITPVIFKMAEIEVKDDSEDEIQDSDTEDEDDEMQETAGKDVGAELQGTHHHEIEVDQRNNYTKKMDAMRKEKCEEDVKAEPLHAHKDEVEPAQQADCTDDAKAEPRETQNDATTVELQADCTTQAEAEPQKTLTHDTKAEICICATKKVEAERLQESTIYLEPGASRKRIHNKAFTRRTEADVPKDLDGRLFFWEGRYTETEYTGPWCRDWQKWEDEPLPQELAPGQYYQPEIRLGVGVEHSCQPETSRKTSPYSLLEQDLIDSSYATRLDFPLSNAFIATTLPRPDALKFESTPIETKTVKPKASNEVRKNLEKDLAKKEMDLKMTQIGNFCLQRDKEVLEMNNAAKAKEFSKGKRGMH